MIVERVLSDNGGCYRSTLWAQMCSELGLVHRCVAIPATLLGVRVLTVSAARRPQLDL
ncbi:hypothetical protein GCM10023197_45850 [Gordonia humi]